MAGLDPAIHAFQRAPHETKTHEVRKIRKKLLF
jgi:hypothetical protein